ncbi:MAG: dimethylsulfonioproprionate lyase family protein [Candidatus Competibacteraceae bacterium]
MYKRMLSVMVGCALVGLQAQAAEFRCQDDVKPHSYTDEEQRLVDQFWNESLIYLDQYLKVLETPTGHCKDSAEATIQTFDSATGKKQTRCIMKYRDMELLAKHLRAVLAEPDKAKACFDPQKDYAAFPLYTPNKEVQALSPVSKWLDRPLLTDYFKKIDGEICAAGLELNQNIVAVTSRTDTSAHWSKDVSINGLSTLWSSVGWIPFYAENPNAGGDRFRGGYLYAELMGPWGNLRIKDIDGETVGAEIGMTVQLFNTSYPFHYHHPQEIYMTLTKPQCIDQNQYMVMHWDSDAFEQQRRDDGWTVKIDGSEERWKQWFANQDSNQEWLTYFERNAIHAFHAMASCNQTIENSGLVTVWARSTAQDNEGSPPAFANRQPGNAHAAE